MLVSEVLSKVSEKMSRISVLHTLVQHLKEHYVSSDVEPDMYITRADLGYVPQEHLLLEIERLQEEMEQQQAEIEEWNALLVMSREDIKALSSGPKKKRRTTRARSKNSDQAAAE